MLGYRTPVESELHETAIAWRDMMFDIVPMNRLDDALARAVTNHRSDYPVNAFEFLTAFREIEAEEKAEAKRIEEEKRAANPVFYCKNKALHLNPDGEVKVCNPFNFNEEIILPCMYCRPSAYADARSRFIAKNREPEPLKILTEFVETSAPKTNAPTDSLAVITKARSEVGREVLKTTGTVYSDQLRGTWEKLGRIADYIRKTEKSK